MRTTVIYGVVNDETIASTGLDNVNDFSRWKRSAPRRRKGFQLAPAYYVAEFEVTDPEGMKPYSTMVESTFKPYGGHFIVRGGTTTSLEGSAPTRRRVVIEFENHENAMAWYNSTEYVALRKIRQQSAKTDVYLIDGVAPP